MMPSGWVLTTDEVYNEGYISIPVAPYEIPYRSLLPKYNECTNLLVPVCMSASFIANASIRMEPQYMIMGHAAGVAATMAAKEDIPVHRIDFATLQHKLKEQGQVLSLVNNPYGAFSYDDEIIIDNNMKRFTRKTGSWSGIETEHNGRYQMNFAQNNKQQGRFGFRPWIEKAGTYEISIWNPAKENYSHEVLIHINHNEGTDNIKINQSENGGRWVSMGLFELSRGYHEVVTIIADQAGGTVVADAIKLNLVD
jgi:hypothetical protein